MRTIFSGLLAFLIVFLSVSCRHRTPIEPVEEPNILYGIDANLYRVVRTEMESGQTMGGILDAQGVSTAQIDRLDRASEAVFPLKNIRAGHDYTLFIHEDSLNTSHLEYLVYERSASQYVTFQFLDSDSVAVTLGEKPVTVRRMRKTARIESSLWEAIVSAGMPAALASEMEDIYQSTISFFTLQPEDEFTVIYDQRYIDTLPAGVGRVWGAKFHYRGKEYYAIPFRQQGKIGYWDQTGASLKRLMLITPLKYTRISSGFTYARKHPIYKVYRAHTGVDYAAPKGTPVWAVADGTVTFRGWGGGGGNTLKIRHNNGFETGYLHLSGYAKGMARGQRVVQGQLIGYVGSTGASTGPHLDYRVWKKGKPINPLKIPQEPGVPIAKASAARFDYVRERIMAELDGKKLDPDEVITQLDTLPMDRRAATVDPAGFSPSEQERLRTIAPQSVK